MAGLTADRSLPVLRVVQLNSWAVDQGSWSSRRHEIAAWLARLDPDIVCLQEVLDHPQRGNTAAEVVDVAGGNERWSWAYAGAFLAPGLTPDDQTRFGVAILSRWPIVDQHALPLPREDGEGVYGMQMSLLHVRVDTGSHPVDVFTCHLAPPPRQAMLRQQQVLFLEDAIDRWTTPRDPFPPIITGDFNTEPDSTEVRFLAGLCDIGGRTTYHQEAWRSALRTDPGYTWDNTNPSAARMRIATKRIDFIFVGDSFGRPKGAGQVVGAELACNERLTGVYASDHWGVVADLRWPQRPPT